MKMYIGKVYIFFLRNNRKESLGRFCIVKVRKMYFWYFRLRERTFQFLFKRKRPLSIIEKLFSRLKARKVNFVYSEHATTNNKYYSCLIYLNPFLEIYFSSTEFLLSLPFPVQSEQLYCPELQ